MFCWQHFVISFWHGSGSCLTDSHSVAVMVILSLELGYYIMMLLYIADNILVLMENKFLATSNDFLVVQNHARTGDRFYFVTKSLK